MASIKKDNHYVPQAYLRQWVRDGKILTYRLLVPHQKCEVWKRHSPKSIAKHQNLYTYYSGSVESDEIETWLDHDFEGPAATSIAKVVNESRLTSHDWRNLFRFALAQSVRTPAGLHSFMKRQNDNLESVLTTTMVHSLARIEQAQNAGIELEQPSLDDTDRKLPLKLHRVKNDRGEDGLEARVLNGRKLWIWHLERVLKHSIHSLPAYRWTILHAPPGITWPTTDNPFTNLAISVNGKISLGGGWGVLGSQLFLPLSPKHLLYTRVGTRPPQRGTQLSIDEAKFFRAVILSGASRYVFALDTEEIEHIRPRTVSREQFNAEVTAWANWHETQSKEEAAYPG